MAKLTQRQTISWTRPFTNVDDKLTNISLKFIHWGLPGNTGKGRAALEADPAAPKTTTQAWTWAQVKYPDEQK